MPGIRADQPKKHITTNIKKEYLHMAGPYLKSGESIILTTDRVLIDDLRYDLILTSQRLALVDSDHAGDKPQVIPFATILSVKGGTTPAREPEITLSLIDPIGLEDSRTLQLVFIQEPYEDRGPECENWVKKLIEHIVSVRQEPDRTGPQQAPVQPQGINPTVRRWSAPEAPHPHTEVSDGGRRPSEELLSAIQAVAPERPEPAEDEDVAEEDEVPETAGSPPPEETEKVLPAEEAVIAPEPVPAEPLLEITGEVPEVTGKENVLPEESAGTGPDKSGPDEVPAAPAAQREPGPAEPETVPVPENPGVPALEEQPVVVPDLPQGQNVESQRVVDPGDTAVPEAEVPPAHERVQAGLPDLVVFPVLHAEAANPVPEKPQTPPESPKEPGTPHGERKQIPVLTLAIAIVVLIVIGSAAILLLNIGGNGGSADLTPAVTPTVTALPETTPPAVVIPAEGIWVKVSYNGTFVGSYGNPGGMTTVRGTGDQLYPVKYSDQLVQVSFQKQDNTGNALTVEIYNNATLLTQDTKRAPRATVSILADPQTGKAPYVPVTTVTG